MNCPSCNADLSKSRDLPLKVINLGLHLECPICGFIYPVKIDEEGMIQISSIRAFGCTDWKISHTVDKTTLECSYCGCHIDHKYYSDEDNKIECEACYRANLGVKP